MDNDTYLYTGSPIVPRYTLNIGGKTLESDKDFDVEITDNINAGTAHVLIKGKGKFKGEIQRTFEIMPVPARSLSFFADNTEFDYTGKPCVMKVAVRFGEVVLKEGEDYTLEYSNNVKPGTAQATLTFKGNFYGVMTVPFTIYGTAEDDKARKKPKPAVPKELENTSELSDTVITLGEKVRIKTTARGGKGPYTFAAYYRKSIEENWFVLKKFDEEKEAVMIPAEATRYIVLVKAKDSKGDIAKKYFKVAVSKE